MPLQRRYSITGKTPPDDLGDGKNPKLQALDTTASVAAGCELCDGTVTAPAPVIIGEGLNPDSTAPPMARTSSKRSAMHLPSPSTPTSQELPPKVARMDLGDESFIDADNEGGITLDYELPICDHRKGTATLPATPWSGPPDATFRSLALSASPLHSLSSTPGLTVSSSTWPTPEPLPAEPAVTFETLPPEIRFQIYSYLPNLVLSQPLIYCLSTFRDLKQHPLASVSRLIRQEALAIIYSHNTWSIKLEFEMMYQGFKAWITRIGDDGARHLRQVIIGVRSRYFKPVTRRWHTQTQNMIAGHHANGGVLAQILPTAVPAVVPSTVNTNTLPGLALVPGIGLGMGAGVGIGVQPHLHAPQHPPLSSVLPGYCPSDGDASFRVDLSEKFDRGKVEIVRHDGRRENAETIRACLAALVEPMWEKRRVGALVGQDWLDMVDKFLDITGRWN